MNTEVVQEMTVDLYRKDGTKAGQIGLNPKVFGAPINERLLNIVLTAYAANQRSGTAHTKTRGEVRGGGKKPWRQKGTGRARHGSIRSPLWRGGGTVFGPRKRDYSKPIPKQLKKKALVSALSLKVKEENLIVLEELGLNSGKTRELVGVLKALRLISQRALCVVSQWSENLKRASGNVRPVFKVVPAGELNAYQVLRRKKLVLEKEVIPLLEERLGEKENKEAPTDGI